MNHVFVKLVTEEWSRWYKLITELQLSEMQALERTRIHGEALLQLMFCDIFRVRW